MVIWSMRKISSDSANDFEEIKNPLIDFARVDMELIGANIQKENMVVEKPLTSFNNYYYSNCPQGKLNINSYETLIIKNVYEGIDWRWKINNGEVHHEFIVQPGADINLIQYRIKWADVEMNEAKNKLLLKTPLGAIEDGELICWQEDASLNKIPVEVNYHRSAQNQFGYQTSQTLIPDLPLIIDPPLNLEWATFFGGSGDESALSNNQIRCDASNNLFLTLRGITMAMPVQNPGGGSYFSGTIAGTWDIIILKFSNAGVLLWATYFGGTSSDQSTSISFMNNGNILITGYTHSNNFPLLNPGGGAYFQNTFYFGSDMFIIQFNPAGTLLWSTYYGYTGLDEAVDIDVDVNDNIFLLGETSGPFLPLMNPGGGAYYKGTMGGISEIVLSKFSSTGVQLWTTYVGGSNTDNPYDLAIDNNSIFITGITSSTDFTIVNPGGASFLQNNFGGNNDVFICKFSNSLALTWSTYLGGSEMENFPSIAVNNLGNVVVMLSTLTYSLPLTNVGGIYLDAYNANYDFYIAEFTNTNYMTWSTYYGGSGSENDVSSITYDPFNNIFITGSTTSTNLPTADPAVGNFFQSTLLTGVDIAFACFNTQRALVWSTYYQGSGINEKPKAITTDNNGVVFALCRIVGTSTITLSDPGSGTYYQSSLSGNEDALIIKFGNIIPLPITLVSFTAKEINENVQCEWITASEINNAYFEIERSRDGVEFTTIGQVDGQGNSTLAHSYSFLDINPFNGINYYRLKQNDFDGQSSYSKIEVVNFIDNSNDVFQIFPNPANQKTFIALSEEIKSNAIIKVNDMQGRILMELSLNADAIQNKIFPVSIDLPDGIYIISVSNEYFSESKQLVVNN
jgi:hypothetical protein